VAGNLDVVRLQVAALVGAESFGQLSALAVHPVSLIQLAVNGGQLDALVLVNDLGIPDLVLLDQGEDLRRVGLDVFGSTAPSHELGGHQEHEQDGNEPQPRSTVQTLQIHRYGTPPGPSLLTAVPPNTARGVGCVGGPGRRSAVVPDRAARHGTSCRPPEAGPVGHVLPTMMPG